MKGFIYTIQMLMKFKALIILTIVLLTFSCKTTKKSVSEKVKQPEMIYLDLKYSKDVRINGKTILSEEERAEIEREREEQKKTLDASSDRNSLSKDKKKRGKYFKLLQDLTFDIEAKYITGESKLAYYRAYQNYLFEAVERGLKESFDESGDTIEIGRFDMSSLLYPVDRSGDLIEGDSTADPVEIETPDDASSDLTLEGLKVAMLIDVYNEGEFNFINNVASEIYFNVTVFSSDSLKVAEFKKVYKVMPDISTPIERHRLDQIAGLFVKEFSSFMEKRLFMRKRPQKDKKNNNNNIMEDNKEKE